MQINHVHGARLEQLNNHLISQCAKLLLVHHLHAAKAVLAPIVQLRLRIGRATCLCLRYTCANIYA